MITAILVQRLARIAGFAAAFAPIVASAEIGGDDVRVFPVPADLGSPGLINPPDLAITSDGTMFTAIEYTEFSPYSVEIRIYRSVDGGTTWALWDRLDHAASDPKLSIATGTTERLYLAHHGDHPTTGDRGLHVATASVSDEVPSWQTTTVEIGRSHHDVKFETRDSSGGPVRLYVAWRDDISDPIHDQLRFASSVDGGATFSTSIILASIPNDHEVGFDIAADEGDTVYLAYFELDYDVTTNAPIQIRTAGNAGALLTDWTVPGSIFDFEYPTVVFFAASPTDDSLLLVVAAENDGNGHSAHIAYRLPGGTIWQSPVVLDAQVPQSLAWDTEPPVLAVRFVDDEQGVVLGAAWPTFPPASGWVSDQFSQWSRFLYAVVRRDPSRANQIAIAMITEPCPIASGSVFSLFFDAEWRDTPSYGHSAPGTPLCFGDPLEPLVEITVTSSPAVGDLFGDGGKDIVFTLSDDYLYAYDLLDDVVPLQQLTQVGSTSRASAPALYDIDEDGQLEIFLGDDDGLVWAVDADGVVLPGWPLDLGTASPTYVCGGIVTGYYHELVAASANEIHLLRSDATAGLGFPFVAPPGAGNVVGRVAIGDTDGDGLSELVAAFENGVFVLDRFGQNEGILHAGSPLVATGVSLADVDADGDLEIAIPFRNGTVALVHHDGTSVGVAWPHDTGTGEPIGPVAMADGNTDGTFELYFGSRDGSLVGMTVDGVIPPGWNDASTGVRSGSHAEPIVDGVGPTSVQAIVGGEFGYAHVFNANTGDWLDGWPRDHLDGIFHAAASDDLDDDGTVELVIPAGPSLWVLEMGVPVVADEMRWPMSGHDAARTGCANCAPAIIAAPEVGASPPAVLRFSSVHPNPSPGVVTMSIDVPMSASVTVEVFDVQGRLVRTVLDAVMAAGRHAIEWDGRNAAGHTAAGGVYFARLGLGIDGHATGRPVASMTRKIVIQE